MPESGFFYKIKNILRRIGFVHHSWLEFLKVKKRIKCSRVGHLYAKVGFLFSYYAGEIIWRKIYTSPSILNKKKEIRNVVMVYSRHHFDPEHYDPKNLYASSSASNISRNIYNVLATDKNVICVDKEEPLNIIPKADLIIGIVSPNFIKIAQANPEAVKVLFLVNSHPLYRAKVLLKESRILNKILHRGEWVSPLAFFKCQRLADKMILIGNNFVKQTYVEQGVSPERLFLIDSGVNLDILQPDFSKRPNDKLRIVYAGSDLGIRKGLFRIMEYWKYSNSPKINNFYELVIMGGDLAFKNEIREFANKFKNVTHLGWIDSVDPKYKEVLQSGHIILSPSLEEGQVGTVLEAMACGCVPIMTEQCGIPIQDGKQGFIIKDYTDSAEAGKYIATLQNNRELLHKMSKEARKYVEENHSWKIFREKIKETG